MKTIEIDGGMANGNHRVVLNDDGTLHETVSPFGERHQAGSGAFASEWLIADMAKRVLELEARLALAERAAPAARRMPADASGMTALHTRIVDAFDKHPDEDALSFVVEAGYAPTLDLYISREDLPSYTAQTLPATLAELITDRLAADGTAEEAGTSMEFHRVLEIRDAADDALEDASGVEPAPDTTNRMR